MVAGTRIARISAGTLLLLAYSHAAGEELASHPWVDSYTTRLEAYALLQQLNADLLANDSATLTLDRWCSTHQMAAPARIIAERVQGADKAPTAEQRKLLAVGPDEPVRFRRVRLKCGGHVLSEALNWYVPARLTPDMNKTLDTTDTAFGRTVKPLDFRRRTLSTRLLWSPLPDDWASRAPVMTHKSGERLAIPREVLEHQAILTLPDGTPISQVTETYTADVLAFPEPPGGD